MTEGEQSRMRHDLRNGLNQIKLCLSVLAIEDDFEQRVTWIDGIIEGAEKCGRAVELLDLESVDAINPAG